MKSSKEKELASELSINKEEVLEIIIKTVNNKAPYSLSSFIDDKIYKIYPYKQYYKDYHQVVIEASIRLRLESLDHLYYFYKNNTDNRMVKKLNLLLEKKENNHTRKNNALFLNCIKKMIDELMFEILSEKRHTENTLELLSKGEYIARMPKETPLHQSTEFLERLSALTSALQKFMLDTAIPEETKNAWIRNCYWPHTSNKQELTNQGKRFYHLLCSLYIQAGLNEWKHSKGDQNKLSVLKDLHTHNFSKTPKSFVVDKQLMEVPGEEDDYFYIALAPKYVKKLITCFFYGSATEAQKKWVNNTLCNVLPSSLIPIVYGYLGGVCNEILEKIESQKADSIELLEIESLTLRF